MDIKRVKEELVHSLRAYLSKDTFGEYRIPVIRQRPILLIGPPGIGKTAIMEQVAREVGVGLVSYTITHHTRQSAIGLPYIEKKNYGGREVAVTQYTMSEILSSVYERIERFGQTEGILFLDEINCVSETLAPMMLQFLQCKTFGNQKLPDGWVIVAAGNPPEYNKSVRDFDIVTLDRVKKIDVEENYQVWREYAAKKNLHPAILSYLDVKKEHFYVIETTVDGKQFVTARGWEDLSVILSEYEKLSQKVDEQVIIQYLQHPEIAKDFASYLLLFYKYQKNYFASEILAGHYEQNVLEQLGKAAFDERLSLLGLLLSKLREGFYQAYLMDETVTELYETMKSLKIRSQEAGVSVAHELELAAGRKRSLMEMQKDAGQLSKDEICIRHQLIKTLEEMWKYLLESEDSFENAKERFVELTGKREMQIEDAANQLEHAFRFLEDAFGESQEMVIFVTELTSGYYSMKFISEHGSDKYYQYNKSLLFREREQELYDEIHEVKKLLE